MASLWPSIICSQIQRIPCDAHHLGCRPAGWTIRFLVCQSGHVPYNAIQLSRSNPFCTTSTKTMCRPGLTHPSSTWLPNRFPQHWLIRKYWRSRDEAFCFSTPPNADDDNVLPFNVVTHFTSVIREQTRMQDNQLHSTRSLVTDHCTMGKMPQKDISCVCVSLLILLLLLSDDM